MNKIVLGTVQFGLDYGINNFSGKPSENLVKEILDEAYKEGVKFLDTAEAYGDAHEVIGNYHKKSGNKFRIITKFSSTKTDLPANFSKRVEQHLVDLNVETLYCYMFHSFDDFKIHYKENASEIFQLKEAGVIEKFGVSVYNNTEIETLLDFPEVDLIQLPFNLLDNAKQRSEILLKAKERGVEIHTRSVYLQGLFFKDLNTLSSKLLPLKQELDKVNSISNSTGIKISDLSFTYVFQQDYIDKILIGVDTVEQLRINLEATNTIIPKSIMDKIDSINVEDKSLLNPSNWN